MIRITKKLTISCSHHLPGHKKCGEQHGHNYQITVTCEGSKRDLKDGMLVDFGMPEVKKYDHKNLNDFFQFPTVEVLTLKILEDVPHCVRVKIWETENNFCEVVNAHFHS